MTNKKNTKKALFMSAISLLVCFSMLIGTTFAWFTETIESGKNRLVAGNLDVELYWSTDATNWSKVTSDTNVFKEDTLWEPGHTEVVYLKVANEGSLALKYNLGINIFSETPGINVADEVFKLSDYIMYDVLTVTGAYADRDAARAAAEAGATKLNAAYANASRLLETGDSDMVAMVVYMPETVGNEANYKTGTNAPEINLGISLFATQFTKEQDSYGDDYDKGAAWTGATDTTWYKAGETSFTLDTAEKLAGLAELVNAGNSFEGKTIELNADMDLNNVNWTPIGKSGNPFKGTFNGNGHTISNLTSIGTKHVGLFGNTFVGAHIENVNVVNAYVSGEDYVGVIVGGGYLAKNCIKGCVVDNATVIATPYFDNDKGVYDGGAKAGGIIGQAYNGSLIGNTVKNTTIMAYRDLGGIAGMLAADGGDAVAASGNTVENVTLSYIGVAGKYDDGETPNQFMGDFVGRVGNKASVADDNKGEATKNEANKGAIMIFTLDELIDFAKAVNAGNTYKGKTVILGADIDLANMEWTPIGNSTNTFQGTFDGNGHTVSNLKITSGKSYVGLFGYTTNGEVKNLTVNNALVSGRVGVGVVAGSPYTSKYTNITVTGHVEVNGMSYVGGVGGRNAYADWTNITVYVDETSYVKAVSTEYNPNSEYADGNGYVTYRTYVGGVVGFNGEGDHTFKNITSNIDVIGDVCDIGGAFGIGHYKNQFENVTVTGNVTCLGEADEIGGILGVWHNENGTSVSLTDCKFTGKITAADGAVTGCDLVGGAYSTTGTGKLIINGEEVVATVAALQAKLDAATGTTTITLAADITGDVTVTQNKNVELVIDGNGYQYTGTIYVNGNRANDNGATLTIKNVNFVTDVADERFIEQDELPEPKGYPHNIVVDNCTFTATGAAKYTAKAVHLRQPQNVTIQNSEANGLHSLAWVTGGKNFTVDNVTLKDCKNGIHVGTMSPATIKNCNIEAVGDYSYGIRMDANSAGTLTVENNTISAEAPVLVRKATKAAVVTLNDNTLTSSKGYQVLATSADYEEGVELTAPSSNVTITINGAVQKSASSQEQLNEAVASGNNVNVTLSAGEYDMPTSDLSGKTVTISGTNATVIDASNISENNQFVTGAELVFDGVTVNFGTADQMGFANTDSLIYRNCTINGYQYLYGSSVTFENCTFTSTGYAVCTYGAKQVTFTECTFNTAGKCILVYKHDPIVGSNSPENVIKLTVTGCTFNASTAGYAGAIKNMSCAAIEIHNYRTGVNLTTEGNTIDPNFSGEWRIKTFEDTATYGNTVTVNGVEYTQCAVDGKTFTVTNSEATYN